MDITKKQNHSHVPTVIFTDLDATLLDHHTYSWEAATPALNRAAKLGIPVIPCTSKTRAETAEIIDALELNTPFVFENGSGVAMPDGSIVPLAPLYDEILNKLEELTQDPRFQLQGFNQMSVEEIAEETGLSLEKAAKAKAREFSEPFLWQGSKSDLAAFKQAAGEQNLSIISGGRFLHALTRNVSKNNALRHLLSQLAMPDARVIALGDSDNDVPMLCAADVAIVVNNPIKAFPLLPKTKTNIANSNGANNDNNKTNTVYYTSAYGPEGWNSAILTLLEEYDG